MARINVQVFVFFVVELDLKQSLLMYFLGLTFWTDGAI